MTTSPAVPLSRRALGSTAMEVTPLCIGTSPLGSIARLYGYAVEEEQAVATIEAAFASEINFIDTSNGYGADGMSERRIGEAIRRRGGLPPGYVLATKVDPDPQTQEFTGARVRKSLEESMERLGLDRFPLLYLHDPERISFEEGMAADGPVAALLALREEGVVDRIGVAGGPIDVMLAYVRTGAFDVVLTHNRYSLVDRSAEVLIAEASERHMGVVNAAPYGGGILAKGPEAQPRYAYGRGDPTIRDIAVAMRAACEAHGVPLAAAALQFAARDSRVHSTVVGVSSPDRIQQTLSLFAHSIPDELNDELARLAPPRELWIG